MAIVLIVFGLFIFVSGAVVGFVLTISEARKRIDAANERWRVASDALRQLEVDGVTEREAGEEAERSPEEIARDRLLNRLRPISKNELETQRRQLRKMWSDDRRNLEIKRAKAGLPPIDDLRGMWSDDVRTVIEARIKYGTAQ